MAKNNSTKPPKVEEIIDTPPSAIEDIPMEQESPVAPVAAAPTFDLSLITSLDALLALAEEAKKRAESLKFNQITEAVTVFCDAFDRVKAIYDEVGIDEGNRQRLADLMREVSPLTATVNYSTSKPSGRKPRKAYTKSEKEPVLNDKQKLMKERVLADLRSRSDYTQSLTVAESIGEQKSDVLAVLNYLAYHDSGRVESRGARSSLQFRAIK